MEVKGSEAQGRHREVGSEGSVEQRYGPMYKNRIRGLRRRTSRQLTTKSVSIPLRTLVVNPAVVYQKQPSLSREIYGMLRIRD